MRRRLGELGERNQSIAGFGGERPRCFQPSSCRGSSRCSYWPSRRRRLNAEQLPDRVENTRRQRQTELSLTPSGVRLSTDFIRASRRRLAEAAGIESSKSRAANDDGGQIHADAPPTWPQIRRARSARHLRITSKNRQHYGRIKYSRLLEWSIRTDRAEGRVHNCRHKIPPSSSRSWRSQESVFWRRCTIDGSKLPRSIC